MSNDFNPSFTNVNNTNLIGERYLLKKSLGEGSFGEVFLAEDIKFHPSRAVAIKLLLRKFLGDATVRADIEREASTLARFNHPNILRVIDFDISPHQAYIVMDLAEGGSLADKIRPVPSQPTVRMPLPEVARYLEQICDGLDEAHKAGLIHRDLKPLNILLDKRGRPLIADFGLATAVSNTQSSIVATETISGTPAYIAPEQWGGQVGRASDIYAIGVIAYQLITGQLPFQGDLLTMAYQHTTAPIPKLKDRAPDLIYPPALDQVLARVLAKDSKQRTRPAMEFYRQFKAAIDGTSTTNSHDTLPAWTGVEPHKTTNTGFSSWENQSFQTASKDAPDYNQVQVRQSFADQKDYAGFSDLQLQQSSEYGKQTRPYQQVSVKSRNAGCVVGILILFIFIPIAIAVYAGNAPSYTTTVTSSGVTFIQSFTKRGGSISTLAFSPTGKIFASGASDNTIELWSVGSQSLLNTLFDPVQISSNNAGQIQALAFSPDGKFLASGSADNTVKLWDVASGNLLATLSGHTGNITALAFSPDGKTLASASADNSIKLWDVISTSLTKTLSGQTLNVISISFSTDGKSLTASSADGTVRLWDVAAGKLLKAFPNLTGVAYSVALSPDGKLLATSLPKGIIKLWEVASGKLLATISDQGQVVSSVFSPDSKFLLSGGGGTIEIWDITSYKLLTNVSDRVNGSMDDMLILSPDGKTLVSGSGYYINMWRLDWSVIRQGGTP